MIQLSSKQRFYISQDLIGYTDRLITDGVFKKRVDFLMLGYSYAIIHELPPAENVQRHTLTDISTRDDLLLTLTAMTHWHLERMGYPEIKNQEQLLEYICNLGISGCDKLKTQWEEKSKSQIEWDILQMIESNSNL